MNARWMDILDILDSQDILDLDPSSYGGGPADSLLPLDTPPAPRQRRTSRRHPKCRQSNRHPAGKHRNLPGKLYPPVRTILTVLRS